jgi:hypothetical protein
MKTAGQLSQAHGKLDSVRINLLLLKDLLISKTCCAKA